MKDFIKIHDWKIVQDSYDASLNLVAESLFSIGNGRMGQRANFEESYSGKTLQGSYIAGIYYPDKTKVGWWKNGYPAYFAKVLNSVNWIKLEIEVNGQITDLNEAKIEYFERELDLQSGIYRRKAQLKLSDNNTLLIESERFYSSIRKDVAVLKYSVTIVGQKSNIRIRSLVDFNVRNTDANYDEVFWNHENQDNDPEKYWVSKSTKKTDFTVLCAQSTLVSKGKKTLKPKAVKTKQGEVGCQFKATLKENQKITIYKYTSICSSFYYNKSELKNQAFQNLQQAIKLGYAALKKEHEEKWAEKWEQMDVKIEGDDLAQQGIRYNIFQLHQTYTGDDDRLNIGPKGFTGEKYGGSTYWDTEAYCLPFFMSTAPEKVSRQLLKYRYNHLSKAIENAEKLGFSDGAALYPMVTMNGEECHNEWEITFEEIHRNGAIAYAIFDYNRYFENYEYLSDYGLEVLIAISRFWAQRVNWSKSKMAFVILGVTGPNEYENNVNNNWYTNYIAKWTLTYTLKCIDKCKNTDVNKVNKLFDKSNMSDSELHHWQEIINKMYLPYDEGLNIFLQQDGFLDKADITTEDLKPSDRPLNQNWSWDRILRSPFIKQADVLQGLYFFYDHFDIETIQRNFDYYEPRTVHESSLSPCVHSIIACWLGRLDKAYEMFIRTSRLDLNDYNNDTEDGLHITSMAGSWMSIVKGFAGMKIIHDILSFEPKIPSKWKSYAFNILYRKSKLRIIISKEQIIIENNSEKELSLLVHKKNYTILGLQKLSIANN